jgi:hypothetical protein
LQRDGIAVEVVAAGLVLGSCSAVRTLRLGKRLCCEAALKRWETLEPLLESHAMLAAAVNLTRGASEVLEAAAPGAPVEAAAPGAPVEAAAPVEEEEGEEDVGEEEWLDGMEEESGKKSEGEEVEEKEQWLDGMEKE